MQAGAWRLGLAADWAAPLLVAIASALAVFHRINFSAWFDETYSYGMVTQPLHLMLTRWTWGSESNMVLYYLVLKAWLGLTGLVGIVPNEIVLRMPSALAAVGAAVMVYLLGRRLFGRIAGLVAAGLFLMNFLQMILAQMARSYSLELLLLGVSWYALFAALDRRASARRWWIVFVVSSVLSVYAALFSGLVLASQAAALAALLVLPGPWRERVRASLKRQITHRHARGKRVEALLLDSDAEEAVRGAIRQTQDGAQLALEPELADAFLQSVTPLYRLR